MTTTTANLVNTDGSLNKEALKDDPYVVTNRRGVDAWALYFEQGLYRISDGSGLSHTVTIMVTSGNYFVKQTKKVGDRAGSWEVIKCDDLDEAMGRVIQAADLIDSGYRAVLRGEPMVFQIGDVEVERLGNNEAPICRYQMQKAYAEKYGQPIEDLGLAVTQSDDRLKAFLDGRTPF